MQCRKGSKATESKIKVEQAPQPLTTPPLAQKSTKKVPNHSSQPQTPPHPIPITHHPPPPYDTSLTPTPKTARKTATQTKPTPRTKHTLQQNPEQAQAKGHKRRVGLRF